MTGPITYDRRIFADNLQHLMQQNRERQVDIARLLGVSKSTVSAYCSGEQMPRMDKIEQLAHHFGVSRAALIGGADDASSAAPALTVLPPPSPAESLYNALNDEGRTEFLRYGRYLTEQPEYRAPAPRGELPAQRRSRARRHPPCQERGSARCGRRPTTRRTRWIPCF